MMIRTHQANLGSRRLHQADWDSASTRMINLSAIQLLRLLHHLMIQVEAMMMEKKARIQVIGDGIEKLAD